MRTRFVMVLELVLVGLLSVDAGAAEVLSLPTSQAEFPPHSAAHGWAPKRFSGGVMISVRNDTHYSDPSENVYLDDRQGNTIASFRLFAPDAWQFHIQQVAASGDGSVAAVGLARNNQGGLSGYLAIMSLGTSEVRMIETSPFEGRSLAYGPDGSLWILGWALNAERMLSTTPPHSTLRRFSAEGELISEHLPWPETRCGSHPSGGCSLDSQVLAASGDRIGVLMPVCKRWMEFSPEGEVLGEWQLRIADYDGPDENVSPRYAAMTPDNEVYYYISYAVRRDGSEPGVPGLYRLNRESSAFERVGISQAGSAAGPLVGFAGANGESLVMRTPANSYSSYVWVHVVKE